MGVFIVVFILVGVASLIFHLSRSGSLLDQWAANNGLRIVDSEKRWLVRGPFFWTTSKGQDVYHVTVEDAQGNRRSGYVRVGGAMFGMFSDNVEVRWDDDQR